MSEIIESDDPGEHSPVESEGAARAGDGHDEIIMAALARGMSYEAAGRAAGRSRRTVARRMSDPDFAADVVRRRGEYAQAVTGLLAEAGAEAIATLRACLQEERAGDRRQAAVDLLRLGMAYRTHTDLEAELVALRARLDELATGEVAS